MTNDQTNTAEGPHVQPGLQKPSAPRLVEGIDYYIEAGGWVFTAAYHLRRGSCCGSGCRHCPYSKVPAEHCPKIPGQS